MKRGKFNLSHYRNLTCNQGQLVPCGLVEVLPGDSVQHATSLLVRTQPLVRPVMHPVHARVHSFFIPMRLLWNDWETFITGGADPDTVPTFPTITVNNVAVGSLADYLGVPTGVAQDVAVSALPFRAYALVFNEFFRDQDLVTALTIDKTDGADTTTNTTLQNCAWEKDYFTSARPWAQKGDAVVLPLGETAPIIPDTDSQIPTWQAQASGTSLSLRASLNNTDVFLDANSDATGNLRWQNPNLLADLSNATAATINDLRLAMALQRWQEARARYGSRYTEYLRFLGVRSSDARLQRPEYLGGGKQTLQFSEVLQVAPTTSGSVAGVADLKGHGIGAMRSNRYRRFFEEHGYVLTLLSVKPRTLYFEGLPRTWNRRTREDFWQKELQHIGQQEILNKEIFVQGTAADDTVFGYQDRYDEYRRVESTIHGQFRTTENAWHMARDFSALPTLNGSFVTSDPTDRIYADTTPHELLIMAYHSMQARRLVAQVGTSFIF